MKSRWFISFLLLLLLLLLTPLTSSAAGTHDVKQLSVTVANSIHIVTCNPATDEVEVDANQLGTFVSECFTGNGYIGLGDNGGNDLFSITSWSSGPYCGWFRTYDSSGHGNTIPFSSYTTAYSEIAGSPYDLFDKMTQVDIEGTNCNAIT